MTASFRTPVVFCVFNRPEFTRRSFAAIAAAKPPQLLIIADGPRADHPADESLVAETRAILEQIDWPCEVQRRYGETNLGCRLNIATGLDWAFSEIEEAVVLEDDTVPHPSFFPFCEELLARYRNDENIHHISGSTLFEPHEFTASSYYLSQCYQVWGWATWARAWHNYDLEMRRWPEVRGTRWLEELITNRDAAMKVRDLFDAAFDGAATTWDFQWVFSSWLAGGTAVAPSVNLVTNIGYGGLASHERDDDHVNANRMSHPMDDPLRHPKDRAILEAADSELWRWYAAGFPARSPRSRQSERIRDHLRSVMGRR